MAPAAADNEMGTATTSVKIQADSLNIRSFERSWLLYAEAVRSCKNVIVRSFIGIREPRHLSAGVLGIHTWEGTSNATSTPESQSRACGRARMRAHTASPRAIPTIIPEQKTTAVRGQLFRNAENVRPRMVRERF